MSDDITCRRTREGLTEYLDGALSPERRQGFERHLAICDRCRRMLAQTKRIIASAADGPRERMPPEMKARLLRHLAQNGEPETLAAGRSQG